MDSHMSDPILDVHICSNHVSAFFIDSSWEQIVIRFSELSPTRFLFVSDPHLEVFSMSSLLSWSRSSSGSSARYVTRFLFPSLALVPGRDWWLAVLHCRKLT